MSGAGKKALGRKKHLFVERGVEEGAPSGSSTSLKLL